MIGTLEGVKVKPLPQRKERGAIAEGAAPAAPVNKHGDGGRGLGTLPLVALALIAVLAAVFFGRQLL